MWSEAPLVAADRGGCCLFMLRAIVSSSSKRRRQIFSFAKWLVSNDYEKKPGDWLYEVSVLTNSGSSLMSLVLDHCVDGTAR